MPHKPSTRDLKRQADRWLAKRPGGRFSLRAKIVPASPGRPERAVLVEDIPVFFRASISQFGQLEPVEVEICDLATNPLHTIREREFGRFMNNLDNLDEYKANEAAESESRLEEIREEFIDEAMHRSRLHIPVGSA